MAEPKRAADPPDWLRPERLAGDLTVTAWLLLVGVLYLGSQWLPAVELALAQAPRW